MGHSFSFDTLPFFTHFSSGDRAAFLASSKECVYASGDLIDLRASHSLHIVVSGLFRPEGTLQRDESVLFGPGSLLGPLPFSDVTPRGTVKAVVASSVRVITLEDLYRILIGSYRTARGFIRVLSKSLVETSPIARDLAECRTRIVSVVGSKGAGKTISAVSLARALSKEGKTIILDMTLSGRSLFDYLQMKLLPPLSQKRAGAISDSFINERVSHSPAGFDLMNISSGSKVKIDSGIFSPVLFHLSRIYSYIVIDCGGMDDDILPAIDASDFVCAVAKKRQDVPKIRSFCDRHLTDGQGFFFCDNRFFAKRPFSESLMTLQKIPVDSDEGIIFELDEVLSGVAQAAQRISMRRELFLLSGAGFSSARYAGLCGVLPRDGSALVAAGSLPLLCTLLYLSAGGGRNGEKEVAAFFREEHIRAVTAPVFPDKWLLSSAPVRRAVEGIGHSLRAEQLMISVAAHMGRPGESDFLASTGAVRDLASASFCEPPLFEPVRAGRSLLCAPSSSAGIGRALTLSVDRITVCSAVSGEGYRSVIPLVRGAFGDGGDRNPFLQQKWISDRNIVIDADPANLSIKKTIASAREKWACAIEENSKD
jgi:CRP-like cAMP-binding protein